MWTDLSMLLGHPLAERGGERAKCKAEVVAGILDEGSVIFNVQSNMHNINCNAFDDLTRILAQVKLLFRKFLGEYDIGCNGFDDFTCGFTLVRVRE